MVPSACDLKLGLYNPSSTRFATHNAYSPFSATLPLPLKVPYFCFQYSTDSKYTIYSLCKGLELGNITFLKHKFHNPSGRMGWGHAMSSEDCN